MNAITSDMMRLLRHNRARMAPMSTYASWPEALRTTLLLWGFVLVVFLPLIIQRHDGDWTSVLLDCSTLLMSIIFSLGMYVVSRATIGMKAVIRIPLRTATVLAVAVVNTVFDLLFQGWIANNVVAAWDALPSDLVRAYASTVNYILVFGVNMILFHVNHTRNLAVAQERQFAELKSTAQQAQLAALRYQLNPHFLFNALNSISALIVTRRNEDAEAMTHQLSSFLRSSLEADPNGLIPLEDELALTEEYLDIEGVRFGDRLDVSIDCEPGACGALVPSFLVQPLVENAIKHSVARSSEPVEIDIGAVMEDGTLCITVANCLPRGDPEDQPLRGTAGAGVGIANVRRRLTTLFGEQATLVAEARDGRFVATLCIPQVNQPN